MNLKELREIVAGSNNKNWLSERAVTINYFGFNEPVKKEGISDIYRFFYNQNKEWKKLPENKPKQLEKVEIHFKNCVNKISRFVETIDKKNENQRDNEWRELQREIVKNKLGPETKILISSIPHVSFLFKVYADYPSSFDGSYDYLILGKLDRNILSTNNPNQEYFRGLLLAYEFELQDHTALLQRRNNEKKSLGQLRSNFEEYLSKVETSTFEYLRDTKDKFDKHSEQIVSLKDNKEDTFETWFNGVKESFDSFDTNSHNKIEELEKLYTEKLRLDAPVQYWSNRAFWMNIFSGLSIATLIAIVGGGIWILYSLLTEDLEIYNVENIFGDSGALKWSIIYITLFSFLAYLVRTLAKVSFSFLHLARDAEERKQLTHVYLALSEESEMSKEDREIVLQSIFSRADTGLLKGDSSPTMPGIILEKLNGK